MHAQDLAIILASTTGNLTITDHVGRFGPYVAINDEVGLIEVTETRDAAVDRVAAALMLVVKTA